MIILEMSSEVKVTVTPKWYATLCHPKIHPHTNFRIPTLNDIEDMAGTKNLTERRTDRIKHTYSPQNWYLTGRGLINTPLYTHTTQFAGNKKIKREPREGNLAQRKRNFAQRKENSSPEEDQKGRSILQ